MRNYAPCWGSGQCPEGEPTRPGVRDWILDLTGTRSDEVRSFGLARLALV